MISKCSLLRGLGLKNRSKSLSPNYIVNTDGKWGNAQDQPEKYHPSESRRSPPHPVREVHEQPLVKGLARKNESLTGSQATRKSRKKTEFF